MKKGAIVKVLSRARGLGVTLLAPTLLLTLLGGFDVAAQAPGSGTVEIVADRFSVRESQSRSEFTGNVVITQEGLKVWAERVVVNYGAGGTSDIKSFEALGDVRIQSETQTATGDRAVYDPKTRILRLSGNVKLVTAGGIVNASEMLVDLNSNVTEFSSPGDGGRVTGVFTPDN